MRITICGRIRRGNGLERTMQPLPIGFTEKGLHLLLRNNLQLTNPFLKAKA